MSAAAVRRAVRESVSGLPREFWWLWTSTLVNRLGGFVATFLVLYLTADQGHSAAYAGLVVSLYGLGGVVSSIGGGVMADRLGRRPTLLIAQTSTALSVAALAFVHHPAAIAAVACLVGMATNASRPAVQAMMADIVPPEDRVRAFSLNYWAINLGFAVSAVAAGFIAEHSYRAGFLGEAAMTLLCAVLVWVKVPESRPERDPAAGADEPGVGLGTVLRDGRFMGVVGLSFLIALIFMQGHVGLPLAMGEDGFSTSDFGTVMALNGVLIVVLQIPVTRFIEHRDPRRLLIVSSLLAGYGFGLTAFAGSLAFYALTVAVWTLAEIVNAPTQTGLVVRLSPVHGRGRYQGVYALSWSVATLVAPLAAGFVIDGFGAAWLWGMSAALGTVAGLGYWALMRRLPEGVVASGSGSPAGAGAGAVAPAEESAVGARTGAERG
ncbi:MDR family MFS transporter [Streptomyces clavuligerus]|uniref:Putative permease of the major facilitator superfamily n=1 Tax=Streptomyces clavuligerus TaxID=1901 RepID=E2PYV8_STRCL|nr:MFS transporter [Streptomyces clavuligerus]EFG08289.1 Putative permease of the major facilitator superfamily [Streptomyces clavuligerus]MBY6303537.1 MFS transporter [Streptomyces clavuligerus]QPL63630.1 MFS transporter [Streptomyces clavuligerus]QPL69658.1 MFS transporter [Streptomyces clavuligerus]QPL75740.1 MFS transporter [Streptomyces clavuligerus]